MKTKRIATLTIALLLVQAGFGSTAFWKTFQEKYQIKEGSNLYKASCTICHEGKKGGKRNAFGRDVYTILHNEGTKKLTAALLGKVENLSSMNDGVKNIDKIKADKNPGE